MTGLPIKTGKAIHLAQLQAELEQLQNQLSAADGSPSSSTERAAMLERAAARIKEISKILADEERSSWEMRHARNAMLLARMHLDEYVLHEARDQGKFDELYKVVLETTEVYCRLVKALVQGRYGSLVNGAGSEI